MWDLLTALGLVLVIEGVLYALIPGTMKRMAEQASGLEENELRMAGLVALSIGVGVVWLIRG